MVVPEPDYYILKNRCPKCKGQMYASWFMRVQGLPLGPVWSVECDYGTCDYVYPTQFGNLEELAKIFEALD